MALERTALSYTDDTGYHANDVVLTIYHEGVQLASVAEYVSGEKVRFLENALDEGTIYPLQ